MKNTFILIALLTLLFACSNENTNNEDLKADEQLEFSAKNFVNGTIAYEKNGEIKLGVTKDDLLNSFNSFATKFDIGSNAKSYLIEEIDGGNYVRFYHKNKDGLAQVSTIALIKSKKRTKDSSITMYRTGSTVCSTTECANCCGCVPSGDYCTRCDINIFDCKRTTTGGEDDDSLNP